MIDALLVYPKLGSMDSMVADIPLSLLYAAADSVKQGFDVQVVDLRVEQRNWKAVLGKYLDRGVRLLGLSVMTGSPLRCARDVSRFVRQKYPDTKIVWGGPHVTMIGDAITEPYIDFLIRGYGSAPLAALLSALTADNPDVSDIQGLSYKNGTGVIHNQRSPEHELLHHQDIPYHLLDILNLRYTRSYQNVRMFPIFSAIGCPYKCSFCMSPAVYKVIEGRKWQPYPIEEVVAHIEMLIARFNAKHICFLDDTSFVDIERMRRLFKLILQHELDVVLEFRGARVNEIDRMDDEFLELMAEAGTRIIMVGVESASDRMLRRMQKGITKEQVLRVNQKLSRHSNIRSIYNFVYGCPGETFADLVETKNVILKIIAENPQAYVNVSGDWKPIPGTEMLRIAEAEYGLRIPETIDEWIEMDSTDARSKIVHPWYSRRQNNLIKLLQMGSFVLDDKIIKESASNATLRFRLLRLGARLYKPIAQFRLRHNIHQFPIEYSIYKGVLRLLTFLGSSARSPACTG